jgi:hypothetical protein
VWDNGGRNGRQKSREDGRFRICIIKDKEPFGNTRVLVGIEGSVE